ncbi:MAG: sugar transferase [Hyphomicrobiales bacterium]
MKRGVDIGLSLVALLVFWPLLVGAALLARADTGASGFFRQERIGRQGMMFRVIKLRTMRGEGGSTVTGIGDARITRLGAWFRRTKLDELPQLWNVLMGQMSLVGPRPDVAGFADCLAGDDRAFLALRPGITGPASLKYRHEEQLLATQPDPERYNREVIWPDKVRLNLEYLRSYRLRDDLKCIWLTIFGP